MVSAYRKALQSLWKDSCTVIQYGKVTDPDTKLTDFQETPLFENEPCKLSFERLNPSNGDPVAAVSQSVKLFMAPEKTVPPGCKIIVTRFKPVKREFVFASSGLPGIFSDHQEITLEEFRGWA